MNANTVEALEGHIETVSDLKTASNYHQLVGHPGISGSRILIERHRDRGIGDLLFTTGVMEYLQHISGNSCRIHTYALADKGQLFLGNHNLEHKTAFSGPIEYDTLPLYDYHWFVESATEFDQEPDQLNVYDALFRQIAVDYTKVEPRFKRPYIYLTEKDSQALDSLFFMSYEETGVDLRQSGYYVVAPFAYSSLRVANYMMWYETIKQLSKDKPVVVIGQISAKMPIPDMSAMEFNGILSTLGKGVINLVGNLPLRTSAALISKASCFIGLDSGPLFIAQALRVPAISLWGTHHPGVRIGYDEPYMEMAIWNQQSCRFSPCHSYLGFPQNKCPLGEKQNVCEPLRSITPDQILEKIEKLKTKALPPFKAN
jgi:ADP-heptose:LPS heptosyltransferase